MARPMSLIQYLTAIINVFKAAGFDAAFNTQQTGNYYCTYNSRQVNAVQSGMAINFNSTDSQFSATDSLSDPVNIQLNGNAMMAYYMGK